MTPANETAETFGFSTGIDELHDVMALCSAAIAMLEPGSYEVRVLEILNERVFNTINRFDGLEIRLSSEEKRRNVGAVAA